MTKKYPVVLVEWEDAWSTTDKVEIGLRRLHEPLMRRAAGFQIGSRPKLLIAQSLYDGKFAQDVLVIPHAMIRKVTRLKEDDRKPA